MKHRIRRTTLVVALGELIACGNRQGASPPAPSDGAVHEHDATVVGTKDSGREAGRTAEAGRDANVSRAPDAGADGGTDASVVVMIAAAGDISDPSDESGDQFATSDLMLDAGYAAILTLGDNQYYSSSPSPSQDFDEFFAKSWGRLKPKIFPATGNHEYGPNTPTPAGYYFGYFFRPDASDNNPALAGDSGASDPGRGYYSFDVGAWHIIALNTNMGMPTTVEGGTKENEDTACAKVSCSAGSKQEKWLKADLASHTNLCTLAYWHQARFTAGSHANDSDLGALWDDLYAAGADIVLNGHDHNYQRFAAMAPDGGSDPSHGIVEFIVGTGGTGILANTHMSPHDLHASGVPSTLVAYEDGTFGILKLTLRPTGYDYEFVAAGNRTDGGTWHGQGPSGEGGVTTVVSGSAFVDKGSGNCH